MSLINQLLKKKPASNDQPLWLGPCAEGPNGGVTQSMLQRFLSCRERFRVKYVLGLEPPQQWSKNIGYGNMWHVCEEAFAGGGNWSSDLYEHCNQMIAENPFQAEEIMKWYQVCRVQFPEYVKYWSSHPDMLQRQPIMQEQVFDVPIRLPYSGRTVRLRGKFDSVDLVTSNEEFGEYTNGAGKQSVYLQENKTKSDIDKQDLERQLRFDLQTMLYLVALEHVYYEDYDSREPAMSLCEHYGGAKITGVRFNVVRRPLSGGKGSIRPHAAKSTKTKITPAETDAQFYERLRTDYIAAEPDYWFFRLDCKISEEDINIFKHQFLYPILEQLCNWYEWIAKYSVEQHRDRFTNTDGIHYRHPFGVYNQINEQGSSEYDSYLETGSLTGLRKSSKLFTELQ